MSLVKSHNSNSNGDVHVDGDDWSDDSSEVSEEEPDLYQIIRYHFLRLVPQPANIVDPVLPVLLHRSGGSFDRILELSTHGDVDVVVDVGIKGANTRYIWRSPRYRTNDVTRTASMLRYLSIHTLLPIPSVLSFSAMDEDVFDRFILMNLLPGVNLASVLKRNCHGCLSFKQRLDMAEKMAELMADVYHIEIPGEEGLIGDVCVEGDWGDENGQPSKNGWKGNTGGRLVVKTLPFERVLDHNSSSTPNSSDQPLATPHTLRSFILERYRLFLDSARKEKADWLAGIYLRLIKVAQNLLGPDGSVSSVVCRSVFVHTDLMARNILVQIDGDGPHHDGRGSLVKLDWDGHQPQFEAEHGEEYGNRNGNGRGTRSNRRTCSHCRFRQVKPITVREPSYMTTPSPFTVAITGVLDWDDTAALPPIAAYTSPNWLWTPTSKGKANGNGSGSQPREDKDDDMPAISWEDDYDPDEGLDTMEPTDALVRMQFITSIEKRIPGYMDTVRQGRRIGIKRLMGFARSGLMGCWEESIVVDLETLVEGIMK
jgi:hypothetical protein